MGLMDVTPKKDQESAPRLRSAKLVATASQIEQCPDGSTNNAKIRVHLDPHIT